MAQNSNTHSVRFGNSDTGCCSKADGFIKRFYKSDEDADILRWLSPLEPEKRHHAVCATRFKGVGDWLLETGEFREWRGGSGGADKAVLFCFGNPGVGKTYLR